LGAKACPRLSMDWGHYFCVLVVSPFELFVAPSRRGFDSLYGQLAKRKKTVLKIKIIDAPCIFTVLRAGIAWANCFDFNKQRKVMSYGT